MMGVQFNKYMGGGNGLKRFHQPSEARFKRFSKVFYKFNPNALSEMNQIWIVSRSIDGAMLKI